MTTQESVVTPERYASGMTYQEYLTTVQVNMDRFEQNYEGTELTAEDIARFKAIMARPNGPAKMMVIGEDWCPDVYRGMPVAAKVAEATGMELRIFPRDQHTDIINEFLKDGEFQSIPAVVFYTKDHKYITHWIERAARANDEMPEMRKLYEGRTREEAADDVKAFQQGPTWAGWRRYQIEDYKTMLDEATK